MKEQNFSTLVSLLGQEVLTEDCLVVVTGGNDNKNEQQNRNNPLCNNCQCNNCSCWVKFTIKAIGTTWQFTVIVVPIIYIIFLIWNIAYTIILLNLET